MQYDMQNKGRMVRVWVAGKTVRHPCYTPVISERFTDKGIMYINHYILYFT